MSEFYNESPNRVDRRNPYNNRYRNCKLLEDKETGDVLLETREILEIPVNSKDSYHRVQVNEIGRLDIIAYQYYKDSQLWWIIAQANHIYDPLLDLEPGFILRIPAIESLYGNNGILL